MTIWMYYETDGDSGYFNIKLFTNQNAAMRWKALKYSGYGKVESIEVSE
jgi:hypothetical protein